jgi:hypothetical protein
LSTARGVVEANEEDAETQSNYDEGQSKSTGIFDAIVVFIRHRWSLVLRFIVGNAVCNVVVYYRSPWGGTRGGRRDTLLFGESRHYRDWYGRVVEDIKRIQKRYVKDIRQRSMKSEKRIHLRQERDDYIEKGRLLLPQAVGSSIS